jgi:hypothetical protein
MSVGLLACALVAGAVLWWQRMESSDLRDELGLLREDNRELARLRTENQGLAAALPPPAQLEQLRADRAAVGRLRGEIEKTRDNLAARERALESAPSSEPLLPALVVTIGLSLDGHLSSNGQTFDPAALRQQLSTLPRGSMFEIRLQLPNADDGQSFDKVKQGMREMAEHAKQAAMDFGLKLSLRTEAPPR